MASRRSCLIVATVVGGTLAAGGANAFNMVLDRDIDAIMRRTQKRPLVTGELNATQATIVRLRARGGFVRAPRGAVNLLSAVLAVSATAFYVIVYTAWLKRRSSQNIVIGGAAGAAPVLIGWTAVTGTLSWAPIVLFVIVFLWTPPHFWALAVRYRDDYEAANVPMLPVVSSLSRTTLEILVYTIALWAATALFGSVASMGALYAIGAFLLGAGFTWFAASLHLRRPTGPRGRRARHATVRLLDHLPECAVRAHRRRRPCPTPLATPRPPRRCRVGPCAPQSRSASVRCSRSCSSSRASSHSSVARRQELRRRTISWAR